MSTNIAIPTHRTETTEVFSLRKSHQLPLSTKILEQIITEKEKLDELAYASKFWSSRIVCSMSSRAWNDGLQVKDCKWWARFTCLWRKNQL